MRGAAALAQQLGVPSLVVGLTGSNLANIGLILAGSALIRKLAIESVVITREMPMMLLASTAALVLGFDALRLEPESQCDRAEGLLLLLLFAVFLYYTIAETLRRRTTDPFVQQAHEQGTAGRLRSLGGADGTRKPNLRL